MDLSLLLEVLEEKFACKLVYHDVRYMFFQSGKIKCHRKYRNLHSRYPDMCPLGEVASCVKHCVVKLRRKLIMEHPQVILWRCRKGYVQVVTPVFRNNMLCGILLAGLWQRPLPKKSIRDIALMLPVAAYGITELMENELANMACERGLRREVIDFLEKHYAGNVTLANLAKHLSLSPSRACHLVSEHFKRPFKTLLLEVRLEKACCMLQEKRLPVSETAKACGFKSVNYFSNSFRKHFGISPKEWQKKSIAHSERNSENNFI